MGQGTIHLLAEQMRLLKRRYRVVGVDELAEMVQSGDRVDRRLAAVTFDDGYEDNYRCAFPILRKHGLTAAFYVTTGSVGSSSTWAPPLVPEKTRSIDR